MEPKKFQINNPAPKKFEIHPEKAKKKFTIESKGGWIQQRNSNDCGPALILNSLRELGIAVPERSIEAVRDTVNQIRGASPLSPTGWFLSSDVGRYLSEVGGLRVEEYVANPYRKQEVTDAVRAIFRARAFDMIYSTLDKHFRGILNKDNQLILLDSFRAGPEALTEAEAWDLISRTINYTDPNDEMRIERIGVVKKGNPVYLFS